MQFVHSDLLTALRASSRDVIVLFELYPSDYEIGSGGVAGFDPLDALDRFAGQSYSLSWASQTVTYRREILGNLKTHKTLGKQLNSISVRVSNVSRYMSAFVLNNEVQGMRLVVRAVSRSVTNPISESPYPKSAILFIGRCERPDDFTRSEGTLSAKPDLGNIEAQMPPRDFESGCPLTFKGEECLGTEALSAKTSAYKQAARCNKTEAQCIAYGNEKFFQGVKIVQITSSFVHKSNEGFFKKVLNILPFIGRRKTTVGNSVFDGTPYGNPVPLILGRWFKQLILLQYKDTGETIWFKMAAGRGPIASFVNVRTDNLNFSQPQAITQHLGEYGGQGTQTADTVFPGSNYLSRLAYLTGRVIGSDVEVEDPVPDVSAVVAGITVKLYNDVQPGGTGKLLGGTGGVTTPGSIAGGGDASHCALYVKVTMQDNHGPAEINSVDFNGAPPTWTNVVNATVGLSNQLTKTGGVEYWNAGANSVESIAGDNAGYVTFKSNAGGAATNQVGVGLGLTHQITTPGYYNDIDYLMILYGADFGGDTRFIDIFELGVGKAHITSVVVDSTQVYKINRDVNGIVTFLVDDVVIYTSDWTCAPGPGEDWTDNPVDHARYLLTDAAILANPEGYVDDYLSAYAAAYNTGSVKDETNAERCLLPNTETANAGTLYKRYNSTSLLGPKSFESTRSQIPAGVFDREAVYEYFDPAAPPTSLAVQTFYRKRYTANLEISSKVKALDFLYDTLFPTGRLFLKWNPKGQIVIDSERPGDHAYLRAAAVPTATTIQVQDVLPWKNRLGSPYLLEGKLLIGVDLANSEVRSVSSVTYSSDGNSITLVSLGAGGPTATASGATLTGGSTTVQASGTVTITGSLTDGSTVTVTIDGIACVLDLVAGEDTTTIGLRMAAVINADLILQKYVEASASGNVVTIKAKVGVLTLDSPLAETHSVEIADPTTAPTLGSSAGALAAGIYLVAYAYRNANGLTVISNIASITITASKQIDVTSLGSLPSGVTSVDWYVSRSANSTDLAYVANNNGSAFSITTLPLGTADSAPTQNTTGEECLRVMMSFAGKALTYADTTRANILDGTFTWPEGGSRSEINQIKAKYLEAILDFGEQPLTVNDTPHQEGLGKKHTQDVDLRAVDNFSQAARLMNGALNTLRDGDFFFKWGAIGEALLLEEGDLVCVSDDSGPFRNVPVRLKTLQVNKVPEITLAGRKYATVHYGDSIASLAEGKGGSGSEVGLFIPSIISGFDTPPNVTFNEVDFPPDGLVQATDGAAGITSIRGGIVFGASSYGQYANVKVTMRAGLIVNEFIGKVFPVSPVAPETRKLGVFEFIASADGLYTVELEVCNNRGQCNATKPSASIVIGFGSLFGISTESGVIITTEGGVFIEQEH